MPDTATPARRPLPLFQFINYLLLGFLQLHFAWKHYQRGKIMEACVILGLGVFLFFYGIYYRRRGVRPTPFDKGEPFHLFSPWTWETPPPNWKEIGYHLALFALFFGLIAATGWFAQNGILLVFGLLFTFWFLFHIYRLLLHVHECRNRPPDQ